MNSYAPKDPTPSEQCPCCDYITFYERKGYFICPICFWEDDGLDVDELDVHSGPNHITLREGRANFKELGACTGAMKKHVLKKEEQLLFEYHPRNI